MPKEYCFEMRRNGRNIYLGKAVATLEEILLTFPYSEVTGNGVLIFSLAR